ncbi:MAG: STAS domain-containing protein [Methylobacter sp.]|jgi:anti-anti-sigma factor|nr:STAS domain-containing protein [Methylobacter sp.]
MESTFIVNINEGTLEITLAGRLDAGNAPSLSDQLQEYKGKDINNMVIYAKDLEYMASAGIRVIVFAVQKILKPGSDAYFIGGQSDIISVLEMTGLDDALIIQETYPG